jgi:hypothetical protein
VCWSWRGSCADPLAHTLVGVQRFKHQQRAMFVIRQLKYMHACQLCGDGCIGVINKCSF